MRVCACVRLCACGPVRVGQVDATAHEALKDRFDVQGFPTLKWTRNGKDFKEYDLGRTRGDLTRFAHRVSGPPVVTLDSKTRMDKVAVDNSIAFVLCDGPERPHTSTFTAIARDLVDQTLPTPASRLSPSSRWARRAGRGVCG